MYMCVCVYILNVSRCVLLVSMGQPNTNPPVLKLLGGTSRPSGGGGIWEGKSKLS